MIGPVVFGAWRERGRPVAVSAQTAARYAWLRVVAAVLPRRVSAMVRVKNEEEFLHAAVRSIVDSVDEVVLVDNLSTDDTPIIMAGLQAAYPQKVRLYRYPHPVARVGQETWELVGRSRGMSPHLSGRYYEWCLKRCRQPFVLKWDGDMIARPVFRHAMGTWRRSGPPVLMMQGENVHPNLQHLVAARCSHRGALIAQQRCPRIPGWVASLSQDALEPRLFPRLVAGYTHAAGFTQSLVSPFLEKRFKTAFRQHVGGASYLHLKFCKRDPFANYSGDLARVIQSNLTTGPALDTEARELLTSWGIVSRDRPA